MAAKLNNSMYFLVIEILFGIASCSSNPKDFVAILSSSGSAMCVSDPPDVVVPPNQIVKSTAGVCVPQTALCSFNCRMNPLCIGYNFVDTSQSCQLFYVSPRSCSHITGCSYYQASSIICLLLLQFSNLILILLNSSIFPQINIV